MNTHTEKISQTKSASISREFNDPATNNKSSRQLKDNRPQSIIQKKQVEALANGVPAQRKANNTGLPDQLKSGIESLSGHSMDDVKVHYNSARPAQLNAHAYAKGTEIHIAAGQEKHLPHEAWHVVQQKQGRVRATTQMKGKVNVNDDKALEKEADVMGAQAAQMKVTGGVQAKYTKYLNSAVIQRFPAHLAIVTGTGIISPYDLLQILAQVTAAEIANIHLRPATDWFRNFVNLVDPHPYAFPPAAGGLSYDHAQVSHQLTVGGVNVVRLAPNSYIHAAGNPAAHDVTSYPALHQNITRLALGNDETIRAGRVRRMLSAGVHLTPPAVAAPAPGAAPNQNTHEAVATTALFGAETSRAPRTFLAHMMMLDRLEAQQPYGAPLAPKRLTLPSLLNTDRQNLPPLESNNQVWARKLVSLNARAPGLSATITDNNSALNVTNSRGVAQHGGKAPMAGAGTRNMGRAPIPVAGNVNLVQAKEVNVLIKWLELQVGAGAFAAMPRNQALVIIRTLIEERARNYYHMTQAENNQRMMRAIIMQQALHGLLRPLPMMPPAMVIPRGLYIRQILIPALNAMALGGARARGANALAIQARPGLMAAREAGAGANAMVLRGLQVQPAGVPNIAEVEHAFIQFNDLAGGGFSLKGASLMEFIKLNLDNITKTYRKASLRIHPDKTGGRTGDQFAKLVEAFKILEAAAKEQMPALNQGGMIGNAQGANVAANRALMWAPVNGNRRVNANQGPAVPVVNAAQNQPVPAVPALANAAPVINRQALRQRLHQKIQALKDKRTRY